MKQIIQFWLTSGIALCLVATVIPAQAQILSPVLLSPVLPSLPSPVLLSPVLPSLPSPIPSPEEILGAANSAMRTRKSIPAWSSIPSRWMFVDIRELIAPTCSAYIGQESSQFIITGRGGLPPNPSDPLSSDAIWIDWVTLNPGAEDRASPAASTNQTAPAPIVEAQGWVINNKGEAVLTARPSSVTPHSPWLTAANCHMNQTSS